MSSGYDRTASITYQDQGRTPASPIRFVTVSVTSSYRGPGVEGYDIDVPDLSGAAGVATEGAVQRTATIVGVLTP